MKTVLVTASDSGYFALLEDWLASLAAVPEGERPDIGVLDLGLLDDQRRALVAAGVQVVTPDWDVDFPDRASKPRTYLAQLARPFLPKYFPAHEVILWIDADCWVQEPVALFWLASAAASGRLVIAQELHSAYWRNYKRSGIYGKYFFYDRFFGAKEAEEFGFTPSLNVGVLALRADAPHWKPWQETLSRILAQESTFYAEQLALDHAVYTGGLPATWLPARANWLCHLATPWYCPQRRRFVEPTPPFDPLWVLHLTMATKDMAFNVPSTFGGEVRTGLRHRQVGALLG
ncbi:MAG: hypothetical protein HQL40_09990 [Alphaproteobacteria bacterium]|nr:hypothetical protein [Alphaproteobacteria bacterium]